jgi:hypothetical protein
VTGLHVRIERGPGGVRDDHGRGWHWAVYVDDDFVAFSCLWYETPAAAADAARAIVRAEIPLFDHRGERIP